MPVLLSQLLHLSSHIHHRKAPETTPHLQLFVHQIPVPRPHLMRLSILNSASKCPSWLTCPLCEGGKANTEANHFQSKILMRPSTHFFFLFQCNKTSRLICMYITKVTFITLSITLKGKMLFKRSARQALCSGCSEYTTDLLTCATFY